MKPTSPAYRLLVNGVEMYFEVHGTGRVRLSHSM
jgi:hypothetical protein